MHLEALRTHGAEQLVRQLAAGGDALDEGRDVPGLELDADIHQHEFGMAEVLHQPDRVTEGRVAVFDLNEGPAVDPDAQVERLHGCFVGVPITFETHVRIVLRGCHTRMLRHRKVGGASSSRGLMSEPAKGGGPHVNESSSGTLEVVGR